MQKNHPVSFKVDGGEHNKILLIRSKKRGAIQPIPIEVDGLSELVPCHLVKVHAKSSRKGEGEGIPEFHK